VVSANANVQTRLYLGATLADNDTPGRHNLSAKTLYPQPLALGITSILGTTSGFFSSHALLLLSNTFDSQNSRWLAAPILPVVIVFHGSFKDTSHQS
jgi:hypothetical protein